MTDTKYTLRATATISGKTAEVYITPEAMDFDSPHKAIEALQRWAEGGFRPAIGPLKGLTVAIEATDAD